MKRLFDFLVSFVVVIGLSPVLFSLALLVRVHIGTPIFSSQTRAGLHGKAFIIVKFRTMTNGLGADGLLLPDSERLSCFGRFLRASSLVELPELWNVLKEDMSLVGRRPLLMNSLHCPRRASSTS